MLEKKNKRFQKKHCNILVQINILKVVLVKVEHIHAANIMEIIMQSMLPHIYLMYLNFQNEVKHVVLIIQQKQQKLNFQQINNQKDNENN